jgi:VanZ family protein
MLLRFQAGKSIASMPRSQQAGLAALLVLFPFFFFGGPGYYSDRSYQAFWDWGHIVFYFVASWLLWTGARRKNLITTNYYGVVWVFFYVAVAGICVELIQLLQTGRNPDLLDLVRNQFGSLCYFLVYPFAPVSRKRLFFQRGVVVLGILVFFLPLGRALMDEWRARQAFPVLANIESEMELSRWGEPGRISMDRSVARQGSSSMQVRLNAAKYSGVSLVHFPHDWGGYRALCFSVYFPGNAPLSLHCRIHDRFHKDNGQKYADRFNTTLRLQPGWNDIVIPLSEVENAPAGRRMDMKNIKGFGLFVMEQKEPLTINLDDVYLK